MGKITTDRPVQHAYEIFDIKCRFKVQVTSVYVTVIKR